MEKIDVVASLGQSQLLRPAYLKAALAANDRLKFYLTALQTAYDHARHPDVASLDLHREYAAAKIDAPWLLALPASGHMVASTLHVQDLPKLTDKLTTDLRLMGRPLGGDDDGDHQALLSRIDKWCDWLNHLDPGVLTAEQLKLLTSGKRGEDDSFHILVMDLHKAINKLAADISDEVIDGAHIWQLSPEDRPRITAFMRGLNRTRPLKLNHPGLDTAATRDGARLLIQNDIGTNDAHVLVIQIEALRLTLTYSDLHRQRFAFFQELLTEIGATWSNVGARLTEGLNAGDSYYVGTATFEHTNETELATTLEALGSRIVFLIDWNRARKRLQRVVGKNNATATLAASARQDIGHMGWLEAGADRLLFEAMESIGSDFFRMGDRLDTALGETQARTFMLEAMSLASKAMQEHQPLPRITDSIRLLLVRYLGRQRDVFELLSEHAAFCHELAEGLRDALTRGVERDAKAAEKLATRAKRWERQADQLVVSSRQRADRNPRWLPLTRVIEKADNIADALEEATFLLSLIADGHHEGWSGEVQEKLTRLVARTYEAVRDHVKTLSIAGTLRDGGTAEDHETFIATCWRAVEAEHQCDELLRDVRRALAHHVEDSRTLLLTTDFASAVELATDALLAASFGIHELAFNHIGES